MQFEYYQMMDTVYDRLLSLQRMENAYNDWTGYRQELTGTVLAWTAPGVDCAIVGAGACNDFDLPRLIGHFGRIILIDRDIDSMRRGIRSQGISESQVTLLRRDLLGISDDGFRGLSNAVVMALKEQPAMAEEVFAGKMRQLLSERSPDSVPAGIADVVICSGVHSQLINPLAQLAAVFKRYVPEPDAFSGVENRLHGENRLLMAELNNSLLSMTRKELILGLEQYREGMEGGIEGAAQALDHLKETLNDGKALFLRDRRELCWPFDVTQGKVYRMALLDLIRKDA